MLEFPETACMPSNAQHAMSVVLRGSITIPCDYILLQTQWMDKITDLVSGVPPKVPPFHMINHEINLIPINRSIIDYLSALTHL